MQYCQESWLFSSNICHPQHTQSLPALLLPVTVLLRTQTLSLTLPSLTHPK